MASLALRPARLRDSCLLPAVLPCAAVPTSQPVEVIDVRKRYRNGPWANDGITLGAVQGEILGIVGPNGAANRLEAPARALALRNSRQGAHFQFVCTDPALEAAGKAYYEYRAALMVNNNEGMTKIYHRFQ